MPVMIERDDRNVKVTQCSECPFFDGANRQCSQDLDQLLPHDSAYRGAPPPTWCPLRSQPTRVSLSEGA